jgi:glutamine---fructose-6-phosphate transaminase (isomerizing)
LISHAESLMLSETREAPSVVRNLFAVSGPVIDALAEALRAASVRKVVTVARGSSDHAASHFAYLLLTRLGVLVASMPPSAITLHNAPIDGKGIAAISFSQSGQSPDLVAAMAGLRDRGALTAALVNDVISPLAVGVHHCVDLAAGTEKSIAATKSFIAQLVAGTALVASWSGDKALLDALTHLPQTLDQAIASDWSAAIAPLVNADRLFVIARGASLAVAFEMALKFKEVCGMQAEAFSAAEVKHGPMALIGAGYRLLVLAPRGPEQAEVLAFAGDMRRLGANVLVAAPLGHSDAQLPIAVGQHEVLDGVAAVQSFYVMVEALARAKGLDPDQPPRVKKVTLTR